MDLVCAVLVAATVGAVAGTAGAQADPTDPLLDRVEVAVASYNQEPERYLGAVEGTLAGEAVALVAFDQRVDVHVVDADPERRTTFSVRTTDAGRIEEFARTTRPDATVRVLVDRAALEDVLVEDGFTAADLTAAVVAGDVRVECVWRRVLANPANARCLLLHAPSHPLRTAAGAVTVGAAVGAVALRWTRLLEFLRWLRREFARAVDGVVEEVARNPILALPTVKGVWDASKWLAGRLRRVLTAPIRYLRRRDDPEERSGADPEAEPEPRPPS